VELITGELPASGLYDKRLVNPELSWTPTLPRENARIEGERAS